MEVLLNVVKNIFCNENYNNNCNKCSLCHLIDINSLPSLKIIEPDSNYIKKEQILELKSLFSRDSQYTNENIYIIKNCEKMNKESANTMLKFLEEPNGKVLGFFITSHKDNVMLTIQSRCQHISAIFDNNEYEKFNLDETTYQNYKALIKNYLKNIEVDKKESILYNKKYFFEYKKDDIKTIFQIILSIYEDLLQRLIFNNNKIDDFEFLSEFSYKNIKRKIELIVEILKEINYNVNVDLLLDKFVLEMDGINNEVI